MTRIQLDLAPERHALYAAALARLRDVELVTHDADVLVTSSLLESESDIAVLLDQPERNDPEEFAALKDARLMPAHPWRFAPCVLPVQESRSSGQLGEPGLLRIHHWLIDDCDPGHAAFPQLDLAQWFFGATPKRTHVLTRENYLQIHLGFSNDGMALLDLATRRPGDDNYYSMHLIGSNGAAYADDHRNTHLLLSDEGSRALLHDQNQTLSYQHMLEEFLSGVREEREWSVTRQDTINALNTLKEVSHV